ncbi:MULTISPECIES: DUF4384 domain-containing protein [Chromobacterium]|uniref:DUF4384 domain-containing protein n=1 Tax=Chromobacterium TaxID=535 RepID=UPI001887B29C|nr:MULTISPECIES: DUF4384 domain-containing protein [Chromobacterium]QOZ84827.1 DUF4384 domain-containing protein [Chromobacterium sp. Rain0013]WON85021.1 DUF4384 domain-containing protein [Chromobacterium haemolyticum]
MNVKKLRRKEILDRRSRYHKMSSQVLSRLLSSIVAISVAGCTLSPRDNKEFLKSAYSEGSPVVEPIRSISSFSQSLACMDDMLAESKQGPFLITSKSIADSSGKAGASVKDIVITSLSQMSQRSGAFKFVDYEVSFTHQDTVQYLSSLLLGMNALSITPPSVYVSGAISYVDQNIIAKRNSLGLSVDSLIKGKEINSDFATDSDVNASVIALELHLGEMQTRTLIPGLYSANSAIVAKGGGAFDGGGSILKTGVQFSFSKDHSQGTGIAIRGLVDLGMIELVGKWLKLPYWKCLALGESAPEFQRELHSWYRSTSPEELLRFAQTILRRQAYFEKEIDGRSSIDLKKAIAQYQMDNNLPATGLLGFPTYERMIAAQVPVDVFGAAAPINNIHKFSNTKADISSSVVAGYAPAQGPISMDLRSKNGNTILVNDQIQLEISLGRSAALRCYYQDASGVVSQIFPNPMQPASDVRARTSIYIPDQDAGFQIRAERAGKERVSCYAANAGVFDLLPAPLLGAGLEPLPGGHSMESINDSMVALKAGSLSHVEIQIGISPAGSKSNKGKK